MLFLMSSCGKENKQLNDNVKINISTAEKLTFEKVGENDIHNIFTCETIKVIDGSVYYMVRGFNSDENKETTFGWYLVDACSGEVYDAGPSQEERIPID